MAQAVANQASKASQTKSKDVDEKAVDTDSKQGEWLTAKNAKQPELSKATRGKLQDVVKQLYDHKCKYKIDPKTGSVTFCPSPHLSQKKYGTKKFDTVKLRHSSQLQHFLGKLGCKSIESMNDFDLEIIKKRDSFHGFARAMEIAYFDHYPLKIKVSHIWLLILHALSAHLDVNHEKLRSKYVEHSGKKELTCDRFNFVKGSQKNDWESVINEFSQQIDKNTKNDIAKIVENDFSVSTPLEQIASRVSLMAACKHC